MRNVPRMWCVHPGLPLAVATAIVLAASTAAAAGDLNILDGSLDARGVVGNGPLILRGSRGFTFTGRTISGNYQPGLCPCPAGDRVSLLALWSGSDVSGTATLDGVTYPRVGSPTDTSSTNSALHVEFHGTLALPTDASVTSMVVPIVFEGTFSHRGGADALRGSGLATVTLAAVPSAPQLAWVISRIVYQLGAPPAPPRASQDIGAVGRAGLTSATNEAIVVSGDGSDVWGAADSFRFVYQDVSAPSGIVARVIGQQRVYPSARGAAAALSPFAKAGVMIRESADPDAASVILDVKPDGGLELMARYAAGESTAFIAGAITRSADVWLRLQHINGQVVAAYSLEGSSWTSVGSVSVSMPSTTLAGLAVTSHEPAVLNGALFDQVAVAGGVADGNLLTRGDFEDYDPPALGPPGWISDDQLRQVGAKSETHQPRSGLKNGACWTTAYLDCGLYQEVSAPSSGTYTLAIYASADRGGGLVGANVNGTTAATSSVEVRPFGTYALYTMTLSAQAGDTIRVWAYSPPTPGYVVVDDAALTVQSSGTAPVSGTLSISPVAGAFGSFALSSTGFTAEGTFDGGEVVPLMVCGVAVACVPGATVDLSATFSNESPVEFESHARGTATVDGVSYPFVEFGGTIRLEGDSVVLPSALASERVSLTAPFAASGTLKGFEVLGLRAPRLLFALPIAARGTATLDLLSVPAPSGRVSFRVLRIVYLFEP